MKSRYITAALLVASLFFPETNNGCIKSYAPFFRARLGGCGDLPSGIGTSLSPLSIILFLILFAWIRRNIQMHHDIEPDTSVGFLARVGAGVVDLYLVLVASTITCAMVFAALESWHLGTITFAFHRDQVSGLDHYLVPICLAVLFAYIRLFMYRPIVTQKATIGQFLFGYRVIMPETDLKGIRVIGNMISAGYCMAMWPITLYRANRRGDGVMWWEETSGFRAHDINFD